MPKASCSTPYLSTSLPKKRVESGCFALTEGFGADAPPFPLDALFGTKSLLGTSIPETDETAAAFFDVSAPVYLCDEVSSTFSVAHRLAQSGNLPAWGAVIASTQTAGRGQYHKRWESPRGNLYVSFRLPDAPLFHHSAAALVTGVLLIMAFARLGYPLSLKWPNDLLNPRHAKAAGILLENRAGVLLAGIGVNLQTLPDTQQMRRDHAPPAGLLLDTEGNPFPLAPFTLWQSLAKEMISVYEQALRLAAVDSLPEIIEPYLAWRGEAVTVSDSDGEILHGRLDGIGTHGGMLLLTPEGQYRELYRGSLTRA